MRGNVDASAVRSRARVGLNGAAVIAGDREQSPLQRNAAAKRDDTSRAISHARVLVLVLMPFVSGYYLSYLYRSINALISEALVAEFALSPGNLGFLTATYFLAFAVIQLPLGVCLDRFGPRRVQAVLLSIAAAGAALFAYADNFVTLAIGRGLIGLGVAGALMAGLKAIVLWFPAERIALANGWFIMLGALGAVTATAPAEIVLTHVGWRGVFAVLAAVTAASALLILLAVPERRQSSDASRETGGLNIVAVYRDSRFWRLAPLSASCIGSAWALQGLWAAPWLADVEGFERPAVVAHLFVMALALSASALLLGIGGNRLRRNGIPLSQTLSVATGIALIAQLALVLRWPVPAWLPWIAIAAIGAGTVLSYAILSEMFPKSASGRANGALNLLHVTAAFAVQYAIGLVIQRLAGRGRALPRRGLSDGVRSQPRPAGRCVRVVHTAAAQSRTAPPAGASHPCLGRPASPRSGGCPVVRPRPARLVPAYGPRSCAAAGLAHHRLRFVRGIGASRLIGGVDTFSAAPLPRT